MEIHGGPAAAREVARFATGRPILVLAGPGNNGGDAYVAARLLQNEGHDVSLVATGAPAPGAAERMQALWQGPTSSLYAARPRPVLVDGLFGTGMSRPLERGLAAVFADLCKQAEFTLSIDLPSGIDTDTGADLGAPRGIDVTLALGALKPGHLLDAGLERGLLLAVLVDAAIGGPDADDAVILVEDFGGREPREHVDPLGFHQPRQPLHEAVQRDDVGLAARRPARERERAAPVTGRGPRQTREGFPTQRLRTSIVTVVPQPVAARGAWTFCEPRALDFEAGSVQRASSFIGSTARSCWYQRAVKLLPHPKSPRSAPVSQFQ